MQHCDYAPHTLFDFVWLVILHAVVQRDTPALVGVSRPSHRNVSSFVVVGAGWRTSPSLTGHLVEIRTSLAGRLPLSLCSNTILSLRNHCQPAIRQPHHPDTQVNASEAGKNRALERSKLITEAYRKIKAEMN